MYVTDRLIFVVDGDLVFFDFVCKFIGDIRQEQGSVSITTELIGGCAIQVPFAFEERNACGTVFLIKIQPQIPLRFAWRVHYGIVYRRVLDIYPAYAVCVLLKQRGKVTGKYCRWLGWLCFSGQEIMVRVNQLERGN